MLILLDMSQGFAVNVPCSLVVVYSRCLKIGFRNKRTPACFMTGILPTKYLLVLLSAINLLIFVGKNPMMLY